MPEFIITVRRTYDTRYFVDAPTEEFAQRQALSGEHAELDQSSTRTEIVKTVRVPQEGEK